jgi:uncharacterized protein
MNDIIGRGWFFPPQVTSTGKIRLTREEDELEQAIGIILQTAPGERVMRPEFGCRLHELVFAPNDSQTAGLARDELVFAPNDSQTAGLAREYVEAALIRWEPRIRVLDIDVSTNLGGRLDESGADRASLAITVHYQVKATHDRRSLVFPFYLIPGE